MHINPIKAETLVASVMNLTREGYVISFGPGPFPKTISMRVDKEDLTQKSVVDLEHVRHTYDPIDVVEYTLNRMVREIDYTLSMMKGE